MSVYIDDIQFSSWGSETKVLEELAECAEHLQQAIEGSWGCTISLPKAAVVASNDLLQQKIQRRLGSIGGAGKAAVTKNLGIDFGPGRAKCRWEKARQGQKG